MANYINRCPGCKSTKDDIGIFGAYFDVYQCKNCSHCFCYKCRGSNGGRMCPECHSDDFGDFGRVSK